jgi:hypothetical protein
MSISRIPELRSCITYLEFSAFNDTFVNVYVALIENIEGRILSYGM